MQCFVVFAIISAAVASTITYPLDHSILNTPCNNFGVYKLQPRCENRESEVVGFIKAAGAVVCCTEKTRWNAKSFCAKYGANVSTVLDFNLIEGENSEIGEFPHMAAIGYETLDKDIVFDCGGALISENFVISAAHCANRKDRQPKLVRLGRTALDLESSNDASQGLDVDVKRIILPNDYSARFKYNDIALFELSRSVSFTENIKPICLQTQNNESEKSITDFTVIGFGITNIDTRTKSNWLLKGKVNSIANSACQDQFKDSNVSGLPDGIKDSQICAIGAVQSSGRSVDSCDGDSGSPLQKTLTDFKFYLYGLTSFGFSCGSSFPSVYTRISSRVPWIEENVWPINK